MNRRHFLLLPPLGVLAGCAASPNPAPEGPEITYSYLPKLRLNVASIDIDETRPNAGPTDVGRSLRPSAAEAVQIMGRDRLAAFGTQHTARFVTLRAAILRERLPSQTSIFAGDPGERLNCTLTCRLEIRGANDLRLGFAEATVSRTAPSESNLAARERTATSLLRRATFDLNTEFEFQMRRALRDWLVEGERAAPPPAGGVMRESL
jgi:hypothetical protein